MKIIYSILTGATLLVLTGCGKNNYYIAEDPNEERVNNPGLVTVSTTGGTAGSQQGSTILLTDAAGKEFNITTGQTNELEAGSYLLAIATPAAGGSSEDIKQLTIKGTTVSLTPTAEGLLPAAPSFEAGASTITVAKYEETKVNVPLHAMTREVVFEAVIRGADMSEVTPVNITLAGVAASADMSKGFSGGTSGADKAGTRGTTPAYHVSTTLSTAEGSTLLTGTIRLLGMDTNNAQKITVTGTRSDGTHLLFEMDATKLLSDFNNGQSAIPHKLSVELRYNTQTELTGSIRPWEPGWESNTTN